MPPSPPPHPAADDSPQPSLPPELSPLEPGAPSSIGPYRLVGRLGAGGMGVVYGALDHTDRCIAVKVVHERLAADPDFRARFEREVALLRRVGGLCTASVHAADPGAPRPWVATDFVPGATLSRHVRENGPLDGDRLTAFAAGVAEALCAIHGAGIVHCDLKPGNVILSPSGPKVLDFGIAQPLAEATAASGAVFGSPGWMSPERYSGGAATPAADVFAWGAVVAYAATGRLPFGRGDSGELARRTRVEPPDIVGVPEGVRPLVERALAKDPGERPGSEELFAALLELADTGADARPHRALPPVERLRALLGERWTGFGGRLYDPALWVAAAPVLGGAALAGGAAVGGAASSAAVSGTSAAGAAGGAGALSAGGAAAGVAGAATGTTAVSSGAVTITAIVGAAVVVTGLGAGGYVALEAARSDPGPTVTTPSPSPSTPAQTVRRAGELALEADSFEVVVTRRPTEEAALAGGGTMDVEDLIALGTVVERHAYTSGPVPVYTSSISQDGGGVTLQRIDGELYEYTVVMDAWNRRAESDGSPGTTEHTPEALMAPLAAAAEATDLAAAGTEEVGGTPATRYSGTFQVVEYQGTHLETTSDDVPFELWIGADGHPLRLEYASSHNSYEIDYTGFGNPVETGYCGTVDGLGPNGEVMVLTPSSAVPCDQARSIVEQYVATPLEQRGGSGLFAEIDGWGCALRSAGDLERRLDEHVGGCSRQDAGSIHLLRTD
ncbi:serine/threonine-protein kinase [Marinactinospora thermotolerans]|uniref:serine/threonine-protein kinase n=1 Tax=Marinactinospora thermotolerans TaxID=531310 RepID=UPI003D8AE413